MKKILIVEDNTSSALLLKETFSEENYEVFVCNNGKEALFEVQGNQFDVIITDWMMPKLDGIELIRKVRVLHKKAAPIIFLITAISSPEARQYAFDAGADAFITKPIDIDFLINHVKESLERKEQEISKPVIIPDAKPLITKPSYICVCIAASTGGPVAVKEVIKKLEHTCPSVMFIVLHGPMWMLETFMDLLRKETKFKVSFASEDMVPEPGNIYVAMDNKHLKIDSSLKTKLDNGPLVNYVRPSADILFRSAANVYGNSCIGVVLTGMGCDGALGALEISEKGGTVLVQDPSTCVVSSMPDNVIKLGIEKEMVPLEKMGKIISFYIHRLWTRNNK